MNIKLNSKYRITSDKLNVIIEQYFVPKEQGEPYWKAISYHPSLDKAIMSLLDLDIRLSCAQSLQEVAECIQETRKALYEAIRQESDGISDRGHTSDVLPNQLTLAL